MAVQAAIADLKKHTLPRLCGGIARLIYLAATRDYNTGRYYHEGLAHIFTEEIAGHALQACHSEIFRDLVRSSIEDLLGQLELYLNSGCAETDELVDFWQEIEPYRVAIPRTSDPVSTRLFNSNLNIVLAILKHRGNNLRHNSPTASLQP